MPKLGLILQAPIEGGTAAQLGENFTRLENVFETTLDVACGLAVVTGGASINTGLATVEGVTVTPDFPPSIGACYVAASIGTNGLINIAVYTSTFVVSVTPVAVNWVALGELVLS